MCEDTRPLQQTGSRAAQIERARMRMERIDHIDNKVNRLDVCVNDVTERTEQIEHRLDDVEDMNKRIVVALSKRNSNNASGEYEFTAPCTELINLAEIAQDVTRNNAVVEVVIKGANYKEFHHLLLHCRVYDKMRLVLRFKNYLLLNWKECNAVHMSRSDAIFNSLQNVSNTVNSLDLNAIEDSFAEIFATINWIMSISLSEVLDFDSRRVIVRSR